MLKPLSLAEQAELAALMDLDERDRIRAECSGPGGLLRFVKRFWKVVEPTRKLIVGWPMEAICDHLEAVSFGHINRLLMNVPPGFMKSLLADCFFPAWEWGPMGRPELRYMCASYAAHLTLRDNRRFRRVIMSEDYQRCWGDVFGPAADAFKVELVGNDRTGWKLATSVGGTGTGERGDRVIIDDGNNPLESESETVMETTSIWFREVIPDRLNDLTTGAIINIQQRTNEGDISGIILAEELGYEHLCYDDQTEILSRDGWVRFAELPDGAEVMAVDPATLQGSWQNIQARVAYQYDGDLIHYRSAVADLAVTPDHRMVYKDYNDWRSKTPGPWRVRAAKDLPHHFYLPQAVRWVGADPDEVEFAGLRWNPKPFARFMGWYLAEGCASTTACATRIVQKEGASADLIRDVLATIPCADRVHEAAHGSNGCRVWGIYGKELAAALAELGASHQKRAPACLKDLDPALLREFILAYAAGDGAAAGRNGNGILISSRSKRMIDDLQECCAKAGWAATAHERAVPERPFNGYTMPGGIMHSLYIRTAKTEGRPRKWYAKIRKDNVGLLPYSGTVYCVSVPATALLVRRNGRMAVSGNCIPMEYDPSRHCVTSIGWEDPRGVDDDGDPLTDAEREANRGVLAWPERFSPEALVALQRAKGPYAWAGQYQQMPTPRGGGLFQRDWIEEWPGLDERGNYRHDMVKDGRITFPALEYVVGWVDTAYTEKQENDMCAMAVIGIFRAEGKGRIDRQPDGSFIRVADDYGFPKAIVLYAWGKRLTIHGPPVEIPPGVTPAEWAGPRYREQRQAQWGLVEWVADTAKRYRLDYLGIETQAVGHTLEQELRRVHADELNCAIELIQARGDKVARAYAVQGSFSSHQIYFPTFEDGSYPSWLTPLADQLFVFPKGRHDDYVDALTGAVKHLRDIGIFERRESWDRAEDHAISWHANRRLQMPYDV